jgi:hypothetical protein
MSKRKKARRGFWSGVGDFFLVIGELLGDLFELIFKIFD